MTRPFTYNWTRNEANFGPPIKSEIEQGTHISAELILKFRDDFVALRRPNAIEGHEHPPKPKRKDGYLYFVHGLPIWGESVENFVGRLTFEQAGVKVKEYKIIDVEMETYSDTKQWAITPYFLVELKSLPRAGTYGNQVSEIVRFQIDSIPDEFGWWNQLDMCTFLSKTF